MVGQSTIDTSREKLHRSGISGSTSGRLVVTLLRRIYVRPLSSGVSGTGVIIRCTRSIWPNVSDPVDHVGPIWDPPDPKDYIY